MLTSIMFAAMSGRVKIIVALVLLTWILVTGKLGKLASSYSSQVNHNGFISESIISSPQPHPLNSSSNEEFGKWKAMQSSQ